MKIGYARVSTDEQNLDLQRDGLEEAGCEIVHEDQGITGTSKQRKGLDEALNQLKSGDILVVWKLDRLGRSLGFLCSLIEQLGKEGKGFQSLTEGIDTTTSSGKLVFHIIGALAEFEHDLIRERTKEGMKAAKKRGKHIGRPKLLNDTKINHMKDLINSGESQRYVAEILGVSTNTIWRQCKLLNSYQ